MSAQLVLTDLEMEALKMCVEAAASGGEIAISRDEFNIAERAIAKFTPHLNRKSRRRRPKR